MASKHILLAIAAAAAASVLPVAITVEILVGDDSGWRPDFDYTEWANGMQFRVGDKLVFNYMPGEHNVVEVGEAAFGNCTAPKGNKVLATGHDEVPLNTSGSKWYISTKGDDCQLGQQKLQIEVIPAIFTKAAASPSLLPPRTSAAAAMMTIMMVVVVAA